jgi:hypothetical protein
MSTLELKVYEIFNKKLSEDEAAVVTEYFDHKAEEKINQKKEIFLTKDDKIDIIKSIYLVNLVQFLATVTSIIAIIKFMMK